MGITNQRIGRILREKRESLGLSQQQVADYAKVTKSAVSRWENGEVSNMGRSKIQSVSEILRISPVSIVLGEDPEQNSIVPYKTKKVPLLGEIAAGEPIYANEQHTVYMEIDENINVDFCLKVKGDSKIEARINDGDVVFVKEQSCVDNGEIAAVLIDEEVTLKRFYKDGDLVMLKPENSKYRPLMYTEKDFKDIRVLGKAVFFQSRVL